MPECKECIERRWLEDMFGDDGGAFVVSGGEVLEINQHETETNYEDIPFIFQVTK